MSTKWTGINAPWFEVEGFLDLLVDKVSILDILNKWGIGFSPCQTGDFTHKLRCPLPSHTIAGGRERTASFYVSEDQNKFFCFGCLAKGNVIDFVSLYTGKPFYEAVKWLSAYAGITSENIDEDFVAKKKKKKDPEKTVAIHVYRTGAIIRDHIKKLKGKEEYAKWCKWADKRFFRLDEFMNSLDDSDWEKVKIYSERVLKFLKK